MKRLLHPWPKFAATLLLYGGLAAGAAFGIGWTMRLAFTSDVQAVEKHRGDLIAACRALGGAPHLDWTLQLHECWLPADTR